MELKTLEGFRSDAYRAIDILTEAHNRITLEKSRFLDSRKLEEELELVAMSLNLARNELYRACGRISDIKGKYGYHDTGN